MENRRLLSVRERISLIVSILNKVRRNDFIKLRHECRISVPQKVAIPPFIEAIKNRENVDESL